MSENVAYVQFTPELPHAHEWKIITTCHDFRANIWKVLRYCELCDEFQNVTVEGPVTE